MKRPYLWRLYHYFDSGDGIYCKQIDSNIPSHKFFNSHTFKKQCNRETLCTTSCYPNSGTVFHNLYWYITILICNKKTCQPLRFSTFIANVMTCKLAKYTSKAAVSFATIQIANGTLKQLSHNNIQHTTNPSA